MYKVGSFNIMPFKLVHDVTCYGYLIHHREIGKLLFVTDTAYIPYKFSGLSNILIECNYDDDIIDSHCINDGANITLRNRVIHSHIELDTCKEFLSSLDLSITKNIVLLHLSSGNSHASNFKKEIEQISGVPTTIADKGVILNLNNNF